MILLNKVFYMIWGQKMDKNEKLWFSTKKRPSYHNILWSEDFRDTRCCGERANKICLLFGEKCMKNKEKDYSVKDYTVEDVELIFSKIDSGQSISSLAGVEKYGPTKSI